MCYFLLPGCYSFTAAFPYSITFVSACALFIKLFIMWILGSLPEPSSALNNQVDRGCIRDPRRPLAPLDLAPTAFPWPAALTAALVAPPRAPSDGVAADPSSHVHRLLAPSRTFRYKRPRAVAHWITCRMLLPMKIENISFIVSRESLVNYLWIIISLQKTIFLSIL